MPVFFNTLNKAVMPKRCRYYVTTNSAYNQFLTISLVQGATQYTHYSHLMLGSRSLYPSCVSPFCLFALFSLEHARGKKIAPPVWLVLQSTTPLTAVKRTTRAQSPP